VTYRHLGKDYCGLAPGQLRCPAFFQDVRYSFMWGNLPLPPGTTKLHSICLWPCLLPEGHDRPHLSDVGPGTRYSWWLDEDYVGPV
jgi:hypothetical protein